MYVELAENLGRLAGDAAERQFGVRPSATQAATTPRFELGDLAFSFPFEVAKRAGGGVQPRQVAEALRPALAGAAGVRAVAVAGGGYLNVFLDRGQFARALFRAEQEARPLAAAAALGKVLIEHTNINPNKAAHIGHVRNAVLGDTLARVLRALGQNVEVQNYIDDTGVQVADVVVGFEEIERKSLAEVRAIPQPFDHYCWDLYAKVGKWYAEDAAREGRRHETLQRIEQGANPTAALAEYVARTVVDNHLATMARIGVTYDLLAWEGDILDLGLWARTFERLKGTPVVYQAEEGKNRGCWVMRLEGTEGFEGLEDADKVLVQSNGTATYVAKDIAYQMWKFGLSSVDFRYAPYRQDAEGSVLWSTTTDAGAVPPRPFGQAARVYNVIDVRQSYLQHVVARSLEALGFAPEARNSIHYSYEMVAVTPRCAADLGFELGPEDRARPYLEMSGRKGLGVKADALVDRLFERATAEVAARQPELAAADAALVGRAIGVGALRYFMLRYGRTKVVAFDFEEALKFQGETGPYLQNSIVRCHSIFRKLEGQGEPGAGAIAALDPDGLVDLADLEREDEAWDLVFALGRLDDAITLAVATLELSVLARWAFQTAQRFHKYYEKFRIVGEPDPARRRERAVVVWTYASRMTRALELMGIPVPDRM